MIAVAVVLLIAGLALAWWGFSECPYCWTTGRHSERECWENRVAISFGWGDEDESA